MARVVIEGKTYTTHCSKGDFAFESSIVINPESPIYLDVGELEHHEDLTAFSHFVLPNIFMGWVHYWTPPLGFKFVENKGFDKPLVLPGDGNAFDSTLSRLVENVAPGFFYKAGTLTNKNEIGQTLEIGEIHSGPGLPDPHAPVRFNERLTIMRAVQLVSNNFSFSEHHGRKAWRLMDNFGTEQAFALEGDRKGNLCLLGRSEIGFRYPTVFKITLPGGKVSTNELYSNGRHQCQVEVEVELMQLQLVGNPVRVPLNSKERDSLTITVFSTNADEPLPRGWSCDKEKNIFDIGIRRSATEVDDAVHVAEAEMVSRRRLDAVDVVERYMRVDPNASSKSVRFMAIIEVDGVRYTTNYVGDEFTFLSYVDIDFIRPYKLLERELVLHYDAEALWDGVFDIDVYYWTPPSGLRFLFNRGLDSPVSLSWEGKISESFYAISAGTYTNKGGVVCGKDVANPTLLLSDIYTGHPEGDSKVIRFNERSTIMRLVRFRQIGNKDVRLDNRSRWRLWDNYGCEQVYIVEQADGGLHIVLEDG
ncbi:hypothetical protein [Pseudomonas synxantha]|uniref:hypothetical protein n=1 Tax=Pseudomonas synxantha TaxID=47883 RepID=UPI000F57CA4D|nr:hypothetical protein [Pseudomonas synxantha]AZE76827.1 hypothetical protein C4J99_1026 [Pseudomonas synxantha]